MPFLQYVYCSSFFSYNRDIMSTLPPFFFQFYFSVMQLIHDLRNSQNGTTNSHLIRTGLPHPQTTMDPHHPLHNKPDILQLKWCRLFSRNKSQLPNNPLVLQANATTHPLLPPLPRTPLVKPPHLLCLPYLHRRLRIASQRAVRVLHPRNAKRC